MSVMSVVSFTYKQNIILSQTQLDDIAHEQTIICKSYLQVTWWLSAIVMKEQFPSNAQ